VPAGEDTVVRLRQRELMPPKGDGAASQAAREHNQLPDWGMGQFLELVPGGNGGTTSDKNREF
jgi:hypothetical protein